MYPRFYNYTKSKSFFLFGPRGVGKTTWLKTHFKDALYIDLLHEDTYRLLLASPSRLEGMIKEHEKTQWIIIDEVQRCPALLNEVHRLIEDKKWKFILTGSSARKLKRGSANLLAGRALQNYFLPITIWELKNDFKLKHALQYGMLPSVWTDENPNEYLSTYVSTYLKEEIQAEGLTRRIDHFARFLEVISFSQAHPISIQNIARDSGIQNSKTVTNYIEILEDLLLAKRIPVFKHKASRRMTAQPKFMLFDSGIYQKCRIKGPLDSESEIEGPALETLFFHHHEALGCFAHWEQKLYFWRTSNHVEVDFVSYGPLGLFAFETQRTSTVRDQDLSGLISFKKDYPMAKCFLLCGTKEKTYRDQIEIINFEEGLRSLPKIFGVEKVLHSLD